jgi:hypothetical protein
VQVDEGFRGVRHSFGWVWRTPGIVYWRLGSELGSVLILTWSAG